MFQIRKIFLFGGFEPLDFEFVSDFAIRILDFSIPQICLVLAMPA
jgi:hypothetical protein